MSEVRSPIVRKPVPFLAVFGLVLLLEPPLSAQEGPASAADLLPIPPEATPYQTLSFVKVIEETRKTDVSVTEENALLYHGLELAQEEEYEEAIPFLEEALRRDPSLQNGWEGLGWAYIRTGDLARARKLWEYFRRLMPGETLPHTLLAQAAIIDRDWAAADQHFRDAIATGGTSYDVRFWYAQNLMRLGRAKEAEDYMRLLVAEDPDRLDVQLDLASLLTQRLAYDEAVDIYRRVNEELPGNPRHLLSQAVLEIRVGELNRADALCLDVLELDPANTQAMTLRADIAEIEGQENIEPFLQIIDETTDDVARGRLRIRLANRLHLANQLRPGTFPTEQVLTLIRKAIDDDPAEIEYRILYAERLMEEDRGAECRRWVVDILEKDNRHHERAKMFLFELALRERRFEDALQVLVDRYGNFDPTDPMQHYYKSRLYVAQGAYNEAMHELDQMEAAAQQGTVFTLLYHGLTESDWTPSTSVRRLHEHILTLQREGWTLISPADIPSIIELPPGERRADAPDEPDVPATARFIDWIRWALTGQRRFPSRVDGDIDSPKPPKYFAITFDEDQRSSLLLGTGVAQDFGVPFALFTQTEPSEEYVPSRAGWQELRNAAESGAWVIGTQLHGTYLKYPVDREGKDVRPSLPNRIWLPKKNRRESMNEWDRRMRGEFQKSAEILASEMGTNACPIPMVAYPYGDIGQVGPCNLASARNPSQSILSEAARTYKLGFLPSKGGFTVSGDNLLMCRRWEPSWSAEGTDVLRHAYEFHPVFLARRTRAQVAMLMNRPNLANRMLELLRRDGYPDDLCRTMERDIQAHFRNKPLHDVKPLLAIDGAPTSEGVDVAAEDTDPTAAGDSVRSPLAKEDAPENDSTVGSAASGGATLTETTPDPLWAPNSPYIGGRLGHTKANDQVEMLSASAFAGLKLNRNTRIEAKAGVDYLEQTVRPRWNAVIATNAPYADTKYKFKSRSDYIAGSFIHRTWGGAELHATVGQISRTPNASNIKNPSNLQDDLNSEKFDPARGESTYLLDLGAVWNPRDNLRLTVGYEHGYVLSAVKNVKSHTVGASADWKPEDSWQLSSGARYATYSDDNAFYAANLNSFWETNPDLGIWLGVELSTASTSEPSDYYWTPYWDQRAMGVLRYLQSWEGYSFRLDLLGGFSRSKARRARYLYTIETEDKDVNRVVTNKDANGEDRQETIVETVTEEKVVKVPIEDQATGWNLAWGVDAQYEKMLGDHTFLILSGSVTALHEYIDHNFTLTLRLTW